LGRYVVGELSHNHTVWNADLRAGAGEQELALDILDVRAITEACQRVDCVVHLAALDFGTHSASQDYMHVNVLGTWNVLEACAVAGVRQVVVCSSIAAVGLDELRSDWTPQTLPVTEEHPVQPTDPYSVSKYIMEIMGASLLTARRWTSCASGPSQTLAELTRGEPTSADIRPHQTTPAIVCCSQLARQALPAICSDVEYTPVSFPRFSGTRPGNWRKLT
jgi:hypothetical protein